MKVGYLVIVNSNLPLASMFVKIHLLQYVPNKYFYGTKFIFPYMPSVHKLTLHVKAVST